LGKLNIEKMQDMILLEEKEEEQEGFLFNDFSCDEITHKPFRPFSIN